MITPQQNETVSYFLYKRAKASVDTKKQKDEKKKKEDDEEKPSLLSRSLPWLAGAAGVAGLGLLGTKYLGKKIADFADFGIQDEATWKKLNADVTKLEEAYNLPATDAFNIYTTHGNSLLTTKIKDAKGNTKKAIEFVPALRKHIGSSLKSLYGKINDKWYNSPEWLKNKIRPVLRKAQDMPGGDTVSEIISDIKNKSINGFSGVFNLEDPKKSEGAFAHYQGFGHSPAMGASQYALEFLRTPMYNKDGNPNDDMTGSLANILAKPRGEWEKALKEISWGPLAGVLSDKSNGQDTTAVMNAMDRLYAGINAGEVLKQNPDTAVPALREAIKNTYLSGKEDLNSGQLLTQNIFDYAMPINKLDVRSIPLDYDTSDVLGLKQLPQDRKDSLAALTAHQVAEAGANPVESIIRAQMGNGVKENISTYTGIIDKMKFIDKLNNPAFNKAGLGLLGVSGLYLAHRIAADVEKKKREEEEERKRRKAKTAWDRARQMLVYGTLNPYTQRKIRPYVIY